jgi:hypothetical protein
MKVFGRAYTPLFYIFLILLLTVCLWVYAYAQETEFLKDVQAKLAYEESGGVFDFGGYLKGGGERELAALADEFRQDGLRLWIVTLPEEYPANNAERIYSNLSFDEKDVLIVFNLKEVYGKALALKGEKELFVEYLAESRRYFNQYWAKGLANYASLIKGRILEKKGKKQLYHNLMLFSAIGVGVAGFLAVVVAVFVIRGRSRRAYQGKLSQLGALYGELGERIGDLGTDKYTDRFLELSERREKLEASKQEMPEEVDRLIGDIQSLLSELESKEQ